MMLKLLIFMLVMAVARGLKYNDECTTTFDDQGKCVPPTECNFIKKLVADVQEDHSNLMQSMYCGTMRKKSERIAMVCCPQLRNAKECGVSKFNSRIFGGTETSFGTYPWAALIVYKVSRRQLAANCGAVLFHPRYVLSAAHCFEDMPAGYKLHSVRFAEWQNGGSRNCTTIEGNVVCRQDYEVEKVILPTDGTDMALLRLAKPVVFGELVAPICLPLEVEVQNLEIEGEEFTATGWGYVAPDSGMTREQREVDLLGFNHARCKTAYKKLDEDIQYYHLCAGGKSGKDTCSGDSGGPLMRSVQGIWYLAGITSFGHEKCGTKNVPGVYMNVINYLDWIEDQMYSTT